MRNNSTAPYVTWRTVPADPQQRKFGWYVVRDWNGTTEKTHYVNSRGMAEELVAFLSGKRDISPLARKEQEA